MLSISSLFYIIVGQFLFSRVLQAGADLGLRRRARRGASSWCCRCVLSLLARLGSEARLYRAMFLEEIGKDYVRTARAKGLAEHVGAVPPRAAQRADPDHHQRRRATCRTCSSAAWCSRASSAFPGLGAYVIDAITGAGLRDRALDGVRRLAALHRELRPDRPRLHLGRPARAPRLSREPTMPKFVLLWTDAVLWLLVVALVWLRAGACAASANLRATWRKVFARSRRRCASALVLRCSLCVTLLDSVHFRRALPPARRRGGRRGRRLRHAHRVAARRCCSRARSRCARRPTRRRWPTRLHEGDRSSATASRCATFPRLQFGGAHLKDPPTRVGAATCCARARPASASAAGRRGAGSRCSSRVGAARARTAALRGALRDIARATAPTAAGAPRCVTVGRALRCSAGAGRRADGPLPRVRHRPHRQRRALPGAEEHPHRVRDRHAGDAGDAAVRGRARHRWPATSGAGSTRSIQYLYTTLSLDARTCC